MATIPTGIRRAVVERAGEFCEYCRLAQAGQEATFHVEHVVPRTAGGRTALENLALACVSCSLRKGSRQRAIDPQSGAEARLFNPRMDHWREHFRFEGAYLVGLSPTGRATVDALQLNRPLILAIRHEESMRGHHPSG